MQKKSNAAVNGVNSNKYAKFKGTKGITTSKTSVTLKNPQKNNSRTERFPECIK